MRTHLRLFGHILPSDMVDAPTPEQLPLLDKLLHVSDPDPAHFVDTFSIQMGEPDCDCR